MCTGGSGSGGSCGLGRAEFGTWSICTITTSGSNGGLYCGGFLAFAWSVTLVFIGLSFIGGFGAGSTVSAVSDLV